MPSWNLHIAHVERLLREHAADELGIHDVNCFLFGNFVPDIYVGYVVPHTTKILDYRITHLADPYHMPEPDYEAFWQCFGSHSNKDESAVSDIVLGAWAHLVADHVYNHRVNAYITARGIPFGDATRIRKQNDFDTYAHTLDIHLVPELTDSLIVQAASFPQYRIEAADVRAAVDAAVSIVSETRSHHVTGVPNYELLSPEFFAAVTDVADTVLTQGLLRYAGQLN
jgi:hypothetical protein